MRPGIEQLAEKIKEAAVNDPSSVGMFHIGAFNATPLPSPATPVPVKQSFGQKLWQNMILAWRLATNTPNISVALSPGAMALEQQLELELNMFFL